MIKQLHFFKTVLFTTFLLLFYNLNSHAQTILQSGATNQSIAVPSGDVVTWVDVASINFSTLNEAKKVMVIANFETDVTSGNSDLDTKYRLTDGSNISAEITRHVVANTYDDSGLGAVVHTFSYNSPGISTGTFTLQHLRVEAGNNKEFSSKANMVAIVIDDLDNNLPNSLKTTGDVTTASTSYTQVTGSATDAITLTQTGGVYISSAFSTFGNFDITGSWVVRSSTDGTNFTEIAESELSRTNTKDVGAATFTWLLENQPAGTYYYDVAHKTSAGILTTQNLTLIAVGLVNDLDGNIFPTFKSSGVSNSTTSSSAVTASSINALASKTAANSLFTHATFSMTAPNTIVAPEFSIGVTNSTFNPISFIRYIPAGKTGRGGLVGLATDIALNTTPEISLNHQSDGTNSLTTSNINLVGFYLGSTAPSPTLSSTEQEAKLVKVIPMVISNRIKVMGNIEQPATINIYDTLGRLMLTESIKQENYNEVNVPSLKNGIYIVKVKTAEREFSTKIAWY